MKYILFAIIILVLLVFLGAYICFLKAFSVKREKTQDTHKLPDTKQHRMYKDTLLELIDKAEQIPYEEISAVSFDGKRLFGRLYMQSPDAPFEILFHGYRDNAVSDFSGGLPLAMSYGHNVILVDQRAHCCSEGSFLSFGILERRDVVSWVDFVRKNYGQDTEIILMGISMGAATVLMASDLDIEPNVKGIIADCGYSSPEAIVKKVAQDMKLPGFVISLVRLGAKIFGGFNLNDASAADSLKHAKAPVLFIHGESDDFVPIEMTLENYMACSSDKVLFTVPEAGHGLSFMFDKDGYIAAVTDFVNKVL